MFYFPDMACVSLEIGPSGGRSVRVYRPVNRMDEPIRQIIPNELPGDGKDRIQKRQISADARQRVWIEEKRGIVVVKAERALVQGIIQLLFRRAACDPG